MSETENTQPDSATPSYPTQGERITPGSRRDLLPNNYDAKKARILFVHAHPDDETSSTGATMAYYAQKGAEVYLLTATRGELGEVIPEELHHLEVGKPGCRDNGEALGEYRTGELAGAIKALGVKKQFFPLSRRARCRCTVTPAWRGARRVSPSLTRWRRRIR